MEIVNTRISATPRSKYVKYGVSSSVGGSNVVASIDTSNFVKLTGATEQIVSGNLGATGDIIAYQTSTADITLPIASSTALGTIKVGEGLSITEDGTVSVTGGGGSGKAQWGYITGTLSSQTDLWNELQKKANTSDLNISNWDSVYTTVTNNSANWNMAYKNNHTHSNKNYLDYINQSLSTASPVNFLSIETSDNIVSEKDIYANNKMYTQTLQAYTSVNTKDVIASGNVKAQGDVIAYSAGSSSTPFKYWKPSVDSNGNLSWSNSTSETTPSTVNIKGQGVTYQWSGTKLSLGTINSSGNVSWGSYVDLKGPKGDPGSDGGSTSNCVTLTGEQTITGKKWFNNLNTTFGALYTKLIVGTGNGNVINAKDNSGNYLNIQFNWRSDKLKTFIDPNNNIYTSGNVLSNQSFSDRRLKTLLCKNENILDKIQHIDIYDYTRVDDENKVLKTGIIAQDVKKAFPTLVMLDTLDESPTAGYYAVDYATLGAVISIGGCKELYSIIKEQQVKINELESRLVSLETKTI